MKKLIIIDTLVNTKQLVESGRALKWFDKFGMKHLLQEKLDRMEKYNPTYYIVEADPVHNYGLDFLIYAMYEADGIKFFKQFDYSSSLTNHGLHRITFTGNGVIEYSEEVYSKEAEDRPSMRRASQSGWIFGSY